MKRGWKIVKARRKGPYLVDTYPAHRFLTVVDRNQRFCQICIPAPTFILHKRTGKIVMIQEMRGEWTQDNHLHTYLIGEALDYGMLVTNLLLYETTGN